jgi:hypothetical protein
MKHSGDMHSSEPITEVELSAEDLLDLSPSPVVEIECEYTSTPAPVQLQPVSIARIPSAAVPVTKQQHAARRLPAASIAATFALVAVSTITGVVLYKSTSPDRVMRPAASTWAPTPDAVSTDAVEMTPTLFANPFDASEVFELPPGISPEEARTLVADLLLKRASERQAQVRTTNSRRR